ncbi:hypothetical protein U9M48_032586, partial [Paspalum notatum var. saurae]
MAWSSLQILRQPRPRPPPTVLDDNYIYGCFTNTGELRTMSHLVELRVEDLYIHPESKEHPSLKVAH